MSMRGKKIFTAFTATSGAARRVNGRRRRVLWWRGRKRLLCKDSAGVYQCFLLRVADGCNTLALAGSSLFFHVPPNVLHTMFCVYGGRVCVSEQVAHLTLDASAGRPARMELKATSV